MRLITCYIKPYIQPFERHLALAELRTLACSEPIPVDGQVEKATIFNIRSAVEPRGLASRLAYWECVEEGLRFFTRQVKAEATVNLVRNGVAFEELRRSLPFNGTVPVPNRRCLRYGTHGIHEYRGKFFPQLAAALINISGLGSGHLILDPMCGSGTALVEAILAGCVAYGVDLNPLSVLMSSTKCDLLHVQPTGVIKAYNAVREHLGDPARGSKRMRYFYTLPVEDQQYLLRWFAPEVLQELDQIASYIDAQPKSGFQRLMWLSLSNILRRVSWQKDDDLRVRKEVRHDEEIDPVREFLQELGRSVRLLVSFLYEAGRLEVGHHFVREGDARKLAECLPEIFATVDAVITSPPYATALPYLDTDRLSLVYLKLLPRNKHRERDQGMIGNREITNRVRDAYWGAFRLNKGAYPGSVAALVERIERLNRSTDAGFRRRNLPSLLAKYFGDMKTLLENIHAALKPGGRAFVVVGNNHTIAGGQRVEIKTSALLFEMAGAVGFRQKEMLPMEMLVSRDIFKKNASESEFVLFLEKPS